MVYKCKFLKQRVVEDYDPSADETKTWQLSDEAMAALWITIKGDLAADEKCNDDLMALVTSLDVWFGGFNVVHYINTVTGVLMNSLLKGNRPMQIGNGMDTDDVRAVSFPILFGAPYLNRSMALPRSLSNRKSIELGLDIATANFDDLLITIDEVILPDANPVGFIKQEEISQAALGTGDKDVWLQTNWDILKILFKCPTVPVDAAWTATINRAGMEINDFAYGYKSVDWETLHAEIMDEMTGIVGIENHFHDDPSAGVTGFAEDLEHYVRLFGVMDFFYNYDLYWKAEVKGASTAKLKLNMGVDEAFYYATACYVPAVGM